MLWRWRAALTPPPERTAWTRSRDPPTGPSSGAWWNFSAREDWRDNTRHWYSKIFRKFTAYPPTCMFDFIQFEMECIGFFFSFSAFKRITQKWINKEGAMCSDPNIWSLRFSGRLSQEVRQDLPPEAGLVWVGEHWRTLLVGGALQEGGQLPPEAGDQTLDSIQGPERRGVRSPHPVSTPVLYPSTTRLILSIYLFIHNLNPTLPVLAGRGKTGREWGALSSRSSWSRQRWWSWIAK